MRPPPTPPHSLYTMRLTRFQLLHLTRFSGYASPEFKAAFDEAFERKLNAILGTP